MGAEQIRAESRGWFRSSQLGGRERVERRRTRVVTTVRGALCALGGQREGVVEGVEMRTLPKSVAGIVERVQLIIGHQRVANGAQDVQVLPIVVVVVATIAVVVVAAAAAAVVGAVAASWTIIVRTEANRWKKRREREKERQRHQDVFSRILRTQQGVVSLYAIKCAINLVVSYSLLKILFHS